MTQHTLPIQLVLKSALTMLGLIGFFFLLFFSVSFIVEEFTLLSPYSSFTNAYILEPAALFLTFLVLVVIISRVWLALFLTCAFYLAFMLLNAEMVEVLGLTLSPIDLKHSFQLILAKEFLLGYWKSIFIALMVILLFIYLIIRSKPNKHLKKLQPITFISLTLIIVLIFFNKQTVSLGIKSNFNLKGQSVPKIFSEYHGFLFSFYYQTLKHNRVEKPQNYSERTIKQIANKHSSKTHATQKSVQPHVIIFFIEAFADPKLTEIKTSYDPIPNFRKISQQGITGLVVSPELGGRSANPEFELLTGLSMRFVPEKSIPYIDFINKPYPSLAREYSRVGYETNAIHVANLAFFNYRKSYKFLGFDNVQTLYKQADVHMDPANRFPSEQALVDKIIETVSHSNKPQFIFSFPNSTHGLWNYDSYDNSDLEVYGEYLDKGKEHLKTYINAIHHADFAIGELVEYFKNHSHPTVLLILGDHQPSLPEYRENISKKYFQNKYPNLTFKTRKELKRAVRKNITESQEHPEVYKLMHQVPYLIWNNYNNQHADKDTSMNLLPSQLLFNSHPNPNPLYNLLYKIQLEMGEFHKKTDVTNSDSLLINEYKLLQYDIMFGNDYYNESIKLD